MTSSTAERSPGSGPSLPLKTVGSLLVLAAAGVLMFLLTPEQIRNDGPTNETSSEVDLQLRSEGELSSLLIGLQPGRLDSLQDRLSATDDLNRWQEQFSTSATNPLTDDAELRKQLLSPELFERTENPRFLPVDAAHIRMSLLGSDAVTAMSRKLAQKGLKGDELEGMLFAAIFRFVVDNIAENPSREALTPYEVLMFGRGGTRERIWCFAELARQAGGDVLLLSPPAEAAAGTTLVGVLGTSGKIWMFEPSLGIPLYQPEANKQTLYPELPATLDEVLTHPEILGNLSREEVPLLQLPGTRYPVSSEMLQELRVQLVGTPSLWSPRMAYLEFRMPSTIRANFYVGLGKNSLREPGAVERVRRAAESSPHWSAAEITLWQDPAQLELAFENTTRNDRQSEYALLQVVGKGPLVPDPATQTIVPARVTVEQVRVEQLSGKHASALSNLLPIRNADQRLSITENRIAADFAFFRTAQCQIQLGQRASAEQTLISYLKEDAPNRLWAQAVGENLAMLYAEDIFLAEPNAVAEMNDPFSLLKQLPLSSRNLWLMHRWQEIFAAQGKLPGQSAEAMSPRPAPEPRPAGSDRQNTAPPISAPAPPLPERIDQ